MKKPKTSPLCQLGPKVMKEKIKFKLCQRVDQFFNEIKNDRGRTSSDWMKEFAVWSAMRNM